MIFKANHYLSNKMLFSFYFKILTEQGYIFLLFFFLIYQQRRNLNKQILFFRTLKKQIHLTSYIYFSFLLTVYIFQLICNFLKTMYIIVLTGNIQQLRESQKEVILCGQMFLQLILWSNVFTANQKT